ncbi:MAG: hypothetical protein V1784_00930 [bacterium]
MNRKRSIIIGTTAILFVSAVAALSILYGEPLPLEDYPRVRLARERFQNEIE